MKYNNLFKLLLSIIICEAAGFVGAIFTSPAINLWYVDLRKPGFNPPNWIFAPVWTILFVLMGVSLYLIWKKGLKAKENKPAVYVFLVQLILNIFWSVLFFGLHSPVAGFVEIIFLWLAILWTIIKFYKISKASAYLLVPYILWVSFAGILNLSILILNF